MDRHAPPFLIDPRGYSAQPTGRLPVNFHQTHTTGASLASDCGDALAFAAVICDAKSRIIYANSAAETLACTRTGLVFRPSDRSVSASAVAEAQKLSQLICGACLQRKAGSLMLSDLNRAPMLIVLITPLPPGDAYRLGSGHALLAIRSLSAAAAFDSVRLIDLFKLSPAQASLALALYEGKSFKEIAVARNVKVSTLRTHFAEVLNRTGAKGLRDLTRRLGMIPQLR